MDQTSFPRNTFKAVQGADRKPPCVFFAQGKCSKGELCTFSHSPTKTWSREREVRPTLHTTLQHHSVPCKFFANGSCQRGHSCPYGHIIAGEAAVHPTPQTRDTRSVVPCKFFAQGKCQLGISCPYSHAVKNGSQSAQPAAQFEDSRSHILCKFYLQGQCQLGEACRYLHQANAETKEQAPIEQAQEEPDRNESIRIFSSATAHYGDGGQTLKIALASDFSTVRLTGLPLGSSPKLIADLLNGMGFDVNMSSITISTPQSGVAYVKVEDPSFATKLSTQLQENTNTGAASQLKAVPCTLSSRSSTGAFGIECKKVHCSWHKVTRTVWLNYGKGEIAKRVSTKFRDGRYRILGSKVDSSDPEHCELPTNRRGHVLDTAFNPRAWTIVLTNVPVDASKVDVDQAIQMPYDKPRHIELSSISDVQDDETAYTVVRSLLTEIGPLEWWESKVEATGKRSKAKARFEEESDAHDAASSLSGKSIALLNSRKLTVNLVYTSKFKIVTIIYDAVQAEIEKCRKKWLEAYVYLTVYRNTDSAEKFTTLKIEGESHGEVSGAKESLDQVLQGSTAMNGKTPLWSQTLSGNGPTFQKLKQIQRDTGVVINRNKRLSQIRIYGSTERCQEAERQLQILIAAESVEVLTIELSPSQFAWALNGGFRSIVAALGEGKAAFDVVSKPKKIRISGSQREHDRALALLNGQAMDKKPDLGITSDCAVCYTEAEDPIRTSCDHVYCLDCFENLCAAGSSDDKDFLLRCCGAAGTCNAVFPLKEIQEHLSSVALEDVLEASFNSYIRHRPDSFRYCPSPNCGSVYRAADEPSQHRCAECGTTTCRCCHNPYRGPTCAEHKDHATGGYEMLEKFKKEHGIKDCPKCGTPMEKTEGCNHMTCKGCGAHICWVCLQTFKTSGPCYEHMQQKHGGIGLDYLQEGF